MKRNACKRQSGVTLVELMVGMTLALMTTVIIAQVMLNSEGQRRTATSGNDAQVNGALGLFSLARDLQDAGYGLAVNQAALGCAIKAKYGSSAQQTVTLAPVRIVAATSTAPLAIHVLRSGRDSFAVPTALTGDHAKTVTALTVKSSVGVSGGDMLLITPKVWDASNWCTIVQANPSGATLITDFSIPIPTGTADSWNQASTNSIMPTGGYKADSSVINLGQLDYKVYSVVSNNLQVQTMQTNGSLDSGTVSAPEIIAMQAYYGHDTSGTADGVIDVYNQTTPTTADGWSRVLAIRIALVARSNQYEKGEVTSSSIEWNVGEAAEVASAQDCTVGSGKCVTLVTKPSTGDWGHYRYKVYDTVVPLRNVLWSSTE